MRAGWKTSVALRAAWACLRQHRWRSLATVAVCGLGTAGVLIAGMLNKAHTVEMQGRLRNLGGGLLMVSPNKLPPAPGRSRAIDHFISLDVEDANALKAELPQVQQVVPVAARNVTVRLGGRALQVRLVATSPEYQRVRGFTLAQGHFFAPAEDGQRVIVLGAAVSAQLLWHQALPGQEVCEGTTAFRVVGILQPQGVNFAGEDEDRQVFIPLSTYRQQISNRVWLDYLYLQITPEADSVGTMRHVEKMLRDRHGRWPDQIDDVVVRDFADLASQQSNLMVMVTWTVSATSGLLLLMGAVGITTLMILVVRQRHVEIGLRRALGATPTDVALQFFVEGSVLAAAGVAAGLGVGIGGALVLMHLMESPVHLDPVILAFSTAVSLGCGAAACAFPAIRAARLEPSAALRS